MKNDDVESVAGQVAMATMLERAARPDMPVRQILLECQLVVRQPPAFGVQQE